MMPFSVRSSVVRGLLILGVVMVMLLIAWVALQLSGPQLDWFEEAQGRTPYFAYWRTLLYTLIFAGWTAALRLRSRLMTSTGSCAWALSDSARSSWSNSRVCELQP
ncbi:hypothetical protein O162_33115 [Pseudomonas putida SJ3]|nr:hypothetical protein O162_33115 [Pseudomonas putida SJ3]